VIFIFYGTTFFEYVSFDVLRSVMVCDNRIPLMVGVLKVGEFNKRIVRD